MVGRREAEVPLPSLYRRVANARQPLRQRRHVTGDACEAGHRVREVRDSEWRIEHVHVDWVASCVQRRSRRRAEAEHIMAVEDDALSSERVHARCLYLGAIRLLRGVVSPIIPAPVIDSHDDKMRAWCGH